jgi:hypothetical protein
MDFGKIPKRISNTETTTNTINKNLKISLFSLFFSKKLTILFSNQNIYKLTDVNVKYNLFRWR